jgi:hypothetical protein
MSKTVAYYTIKGLSIPAVIQIFAQKKIFYFQNVIQNFTHLFTYRRKAECLFIYQCGWLGMIEDGMEV